MIPVRFTQYLRPDGRPKPITLQAPDHVGEMAAKVVAAGYHFDAEVLVDEKTVSFTCEPDEPDEDGEDQPIAAELVENGPGVGKAIHRLVAEALRVIEGRSSMIPRGGWRLTLRDLDGQVVQTEAIEYPDKVDKDQPQRFFNRTFFYAGTAEGEMVFVEKARSK